MTASDLRARYGPCALVTGASDGIGRAIATELAAAGLDLVLVARREDRLRALADEIAAAHGRETRVLPVDLGDGAALDAALATLDDIEIGLLVAAAGFGMTGPLHGSDIAGELSMIDVNCKAPLALAHWAAGRMIPRGRGGIMLFSSIVAFQGVSGSANYAATKAWNQVFAEGLAPELAPHGVDVLAVAPGPVNTGFGARSGMDTSSGATPQEVARAAVAALGRGGTVRPTALNKVLQGMLATLPRRMRTRTLSKVMAGMMAPRP
jgi:short-subunit dehydrogenase